MFIDNVTTILLMIPVTVSVFRTFRISPIPFILAQALASNIGGTATLIGDPPNIMIGSAANIDFNSFIIHMGPTVAVTFSVSLMLFKVFFRKDLKAAVSNLEQIMAQDESKLLKDKKILKNSIIVLLGVIFMFGFHGALHIEVSRSCARRRRCLIRNNPSKPRKSIARGGLDHTNVFHRSIHSGRRCGACWSYKPAFISSNRRNWR